MSGPSCGARGAEEAALPAARRTQQLAGLDVDGHILVVPRRGLREGKDLTSDP